MKGIKCFKKFKFRKEKIFNFHFWDFHEAMLQTVYSGSGHIIYESGSGSYLDMPY